MAIEMSSDWPRSGVGVGVAAGDGVYRAGKAGIAGAGDTVLGVELCRAQTDSELDAEWGPADETAGDVTLLPCRVNRRDEKLRREVGGEVTGVARDGSRRLGSQFTQPRKEGALEKKRGYQTPLRQLFHLTCTSCLGMEVRGG